jgi:polyhydroxybutyrate depolymerase
MRYGQNPIVCSALGGPRDVPTPENFKCKPAGPGTSSVMIMNGTKDPLNPFNGGAVKLFGLFRRGKVRSSRDSGLFFANLNNIASPPETNRTQVSGEVQVEQVLWHNDGEVEVELISNHGGGHVIPQPYWRSPRILGPSPRSQTDQL